MNKKAIAILGAIFLLIVGALGFLIYTKYSTEEPVLPVTNNGTNSGNNASSTPIEPTTPPPATPPPSNSGSGIVKLTQETVTSPILFFDGTGVTYFNASGQLYQADLLETAGVLQLDRLRSVDVPPKSNISKIIWPDKTEKFLAEFESAGKKRWSLFDSETATFIDVPEKVVSIDWSPDAKQVYEVSVDNGKGTLGVFDLEKKTWRTIGELWNPDNEISVSPDGKNILFYRTANDTISNSINLVSEDGKLWKELVKEGYNFGVSWSPDSQKFIFAKKDKTTQKYQLWFNDLLTGEVRNLNLQTIPSKLVWSKDSKVIYAAIPSTGTAGEGLTVDNIVKIDVASMEKTEYKLEPDNVDVQDMLLSPDGTNLFFKNAQDGLLYYLDLNK